jgi:pimeloyl-ACP methyl ester carboxylesterase
MKLKTTLLILALGCAISVFGQKSKFLFNASENLTIQQHIEEVKQKKADTTNIFSATPQIPREIQERSGAPQHFPYPIIFIHGLVGSADTWTDFYNYALAQGWSYGGHIRFNLNADDDLEFSNITSASLSDVDDFNTNLPAADFYLVNFNCALDGTSYGGNYNTTTQSNQAAIIKQGLAIRQAVSHVLAATGKDKVILFGHSMGGLAARQYLQTSTLWQPDNKHHIAKLITSGTPHGGSNASFPGVSALFADVDEASDAVRDLRRTYFYSGDPGVFLYGGLEDPSVMDDLLFGFWNYDVNCNGIEGNQITGLNQKNISTNLDFSCIISDYSLDPLGGDLVVGLTEAQLKSYYNIVSETFELDVLHTNMPEEIRANYEGFDEPDYYDLSYTIDKNTDYNGFTTLQAFDAEYDVDYDDFVFKTTQTGWVSVVVDNIVNSSFPFGVSILDHPNNNYLFDQEFQNDPIQTQAFQIPAGTYYLEFYADGNTNSWQYPYTFRLVWSATNPTATSEIENKIKINITPNPTSDLINIIIENEENMTGVMKIQTELGQEIQSRTFSGVKIAERFDLEAYPDGVYFISVSTEKGSITSKVVKKR